ncbi:unnamed protein product, partial [Aphanomyces euteiches]
MSVVRSAVAIENQWKSMQAEINKFMGFFTKATSIPRSGHQEEDYIDLALNMFLVDGNGALKYRDVWEYLRTVVPKYEDILNEKSCNQTPSK